MTELKVGMKGEKSVAVTNENTALMMGSGSLRDLDMTTVGTKVDIEHIASSPVGAPILCRSTLTAVDGRKLEFEVEVYDNEKLIGKGKHTRFIVNAKKFFDKTYANVKKRITE